MNIFGIWAKPYRQRSLNSKYMHEMHNDQSWNYMDKILMVGMSEGSNIWNKISI